MDEAYILDQNPAVHPLEAPIPPFTKNLFKNRPHFGRISAALH
jgi:hypothetical protein